MSQTAKLNLLDEELDEASQKYIQESLEAWKESVTNQLVEQMEQEKQAKIEELEEENVAYREQLKEEFTEKMLDGLNELLEEWPGVLAVLCLTVQFGNFTFPPAAVSFVLVVTCIRPLRDVKLNLQFEVGRIVLYSRYLNDVSARFYHGAPSSCADSVQIDS